MMLSIENGKSASAACLIVLPWFRLSSSAISPRRCWRRAAAFRNTSPRARGDSRGQGPLSNASRAASIALRASSREAFGTVPREDASNGFDTAIVSSREASTHSPPMSIVRSMVSTRGPEPGASKEGAGGGSFGPATACHGIPYQGGGRFRAGPFRGLVHETTYPEHCGDRCRCCDRGRRDWCLLRPASHIDLELRVGPNREHLHRPGRDPRFARPGGDVLDARLGGGAAGLPGTRELQRFERDELRAGPRVQLGGLEQ